MADFGRLFAGFVQGSTAYGLDAIQARQEEERERKKLELLEKLRRDTEKEMAVFKENLPSARLERAQTEQTMELATRADARADETLALDRMNTESTIASRARDDARQERYTSAMIGNMKKPEADDVLIGEYERVFSELEGIISPAALAHGRQQFNEGVNQRGWSKAQQRRFLNEYYRRAVRKEPGRRSLAEQYPKTLRPVVD